jgi:hypothetical protein
MKYFRDILENIKRKYPPLINERTNNDLWAEFGIEVYKQLFSKEDEIRQEFLDYKRDREFLLKIIIPMLNKSQINKIAKWQLNERMTNIIESYQKKVI